MNRIIMDSTTRSHSQVKDLPICNEISTSVEEFRKFLTQQKKYREELMNTSYSSLVSLKDELNNSTQQVSLTVSGLRRIWTAASRLKTDVLKEEENISLAHKNSERVLNAQLDNTELSNYLLKKISDFDTRMRLYKQELGAFEEGIASQGAAHLTPKDLLNVMKRMDRDFINLAAELFNTQELIKVTKSQYLKKYKLVYGSNQNPFGDDVDDSHLILPGLNKLKMSAVKTTTPYGPSPFTTHESLSLLNAASLAPTANAPTSFLTATTGGFGNAIGAVVTTSSTFGSNMGLRTSFTPQQSTSLGFQANTENKPFGSSLFSATTTTNTSMFGRPNTASSFGASSAGQGFTPQQSTSSGFQSNTGNKPFGSSLFSETTASNTSMFGRPNTASSFGASSTGQGFTPQQSTSLGFQANTENKPFGSSLFSATTTTNTSMFGRPNTASSFGASSAGQGFTPQQSTSSGFQSNTGNKPFGSSLFSETTASNTSMFGRPNTASSYGGTWTGQDSTPQQSISSGFVLRPSLMMKSSSSGNSSPSSDAMFGKRVAQ